MFCSSETFTLNSMIFRGGRSGTCEVLVTAPRPMTPLRRGAILAAPIPTIFHVLGPNKQGRCQAFICKLVKTH